jgi:hypothetical protein
VKVHVSEEEGDMILSTEMKLWRPWGNWMERENSRIMENR